VILTFDRDYGELIYRHRLPVPPGVVYFRYDPLSPEEPAEHLLTLLAVVDLLLSTPLSSETVSPKAVAMTKLR